MSDNFVLNKVRFFEYGKDAPSHSRFKGTMDQAAIVGYYEYTSDENKNEKSSELDNLKKGGYLGYVDKDEYTFISEFNGWLNKDNRKEFEHMLSDSFSKNGDLWWETIISLKSEDIANGYGLETPEDYKTLVDRCMPKICKMMKLNQENVIWWSNRHVDTQHPHIHLNWLEKGQDKTRTRGKITDNELKRLKNIVATELNHMKESKLQIDLTWKNTLFERKDETYHELINAIAKDAFNKNIVTLAGLYSILPKKGRLGYNSYAMKPYKPLIDSITDKIINDSQFKGLFDEYVTMLEKLANYQNQTLSSDGKVDIATIKNTEMEKLYSRIGNMIIKDFKKKRVKHVNKNSNVKTKVEQVPSIFDLYNLNQIKKFTINDELIRDGNSEKIFTRIPNTEGKKYMYLTKENLKKIGDNTYQYELNTNDMFSVYDKNGNYVENIKGKELFDYWEEKEISHNKELESKPISKHDLTNDIGVDDLLAFTINKKMIINSSNNDLFCRLPNTGGKKYMYLKQNQWRQLSEHTFQYIFNPQENINIYDGSNNLIETIKGYDLFKYWDQKEMQVVKGNDNDNNLNKKIPIMKGVFNDDLYRKRKNIGYLKKKVRRWQKGRNFSVSDSELYREMREWERINGLGTKF